MNHEIYVRDWRVAKEWYCELLGVRAHRYVAGWTTFILGDADREREFTLVQAEDRAGTGSLAWRLETLDELNMFYRRLQLMDVAFKKVGCGETIAIYLRDADGNQIGVYCDAAGAANVPEDAAQDAWMFGRRSPSLFSNILPFQAGLFAAQRQGAVA